MSSPTALVITHGYYYDHQHSTAVWLSDTWAFSHASQQWTNLHPHCNDSGVASLNCPAARFGATATLHDNSLYLYGGDDGGNSAGASSYTYNLLSDLWLLPLHSSQPTWSMVATQITPSALLHAGYVSSSLLASIHSLPHAQHTACLLSTPRSNHLLVFGGMTPRRTEDKEDTAGSDVIAASHQLWAVDLAGPAEEREWRQLQCGPSPGERFGHAMTTALQSSSSFVLTLFAYGGFRRGQGNYGDLWRLQLQDWSTASMHCSWTLLSTTTDRTSESFSAVGPYPRGYASLAATSTLLLLFAGALCSPGCVCSHETWAWDLTQCAWSSPTLLTTALPQGRYKQTAVVRAVEEGDGVVELAVFGGESYHPQMYHADVWLLRYDHWHRRQWTHLAGAEWLWNLAPTSSLPALLLPSLPLFLLLLLFLLFRHKRRMRVRGTKLT